MTNNLKLYCKKLNLSRLYVLGSFLCCIILSSCSVIKSLQSGIDVYNVFAVKTNLENRGLPIYSGSTPPNIDGTYYMNNRIIEYNSDDRFRTYDQYSDIEITFLTKKNEKGKSIISCVNKIGGDIFKCDEISLDGQGQLFTASMVCEGYSNKKQRRYIIIISGEKDGNDIKNLRWGISLSNALTEKYKDDTGKIQERDVDVYQIFKSSYEICYSNTTIAERRKQNALKEEEEQRVEKIKREKDEQARAIAIAANERERMVEQQAEEERIEELKQNTEKLIGKWLGTFKYNNGSYECRYIFSFNNYKEINCRIETLVNGNYTAKYPPEDNNFYYEFINSEIIINGLNYKVFYRNELITLVNHSGNKITMKKIK